jgi:hypothetical protein
MMTPEQQRAMTAQLGTLELGFARVAHNRGQSAPVATSRTGDMNEPHELRRATTRDSDAAGDASQAAVFAAGVEK